MRAAPRPATAAGAAAAPITTGATTACTRSTSRRSNSEPSSAPPPSNSTVSAPRASSSASSASRSTPPPAAAGSTAISAPRAPIASRQAASEAAVVAISAGAGPPSTRAEGGVRPRASATTRSGWWTPSAEPPGRAVSCGSSAATVFEPTTIASRPQRSRCVHSRASGPDTQRESPEEAAMRPSSEAANLAITKGRPVRRWCR